MKRSSAIDKMLGPLFMGTKPEKKYSPPKEHSFKFDHGIVSFKRGRRDTEVYAQPEEGYKWTGVGFEKISEIINGSVFITASDRYGTSLGIAQFTNEMKQYGGKRVK